MKQDAKVFFVRFEASKMSRLQHFCHALKALARNVKMKVQLVTQRFLRMRHIQGNKHLEIKIIKKLSKEPHFSILAIKKRKSKIKSLVADCPK